MDKKSKARRTSIAAALLAKKKNAKWLIELGGPSGEDDANMVSEGALTSIQYFNELQNE